MQTQDFENAVAQLARSLRLWAESSPQGRRVLADAAALLGAIAQAPPEVAAPEPARPPEPAPEVFPQAPPPTPVNPPVNIPVARPTAVPFIPTPAVVTGPRLPPDEAKRLLEGGALVRGPAADTAPHTYADYANPLFEFSRTECRCRVKADACDFAIRRQRRLAEGGSIYEFKQEWDELRARASALNPCWLWMTLDWDSGLDDEVLVRAREWYLNLAAALALAKDYLEPHPQQVLERIAEAQSGVRLAVQEAYEEDRDTQVPTFVWLREQTEARGIYLPRFLSLQSPADVKDFAGARQRVEHLRGAWEAVARQKKGASKALNELKYNVKRLRGASPDEAAHHWKKIDAAATLYAASGATDASRELAAALEAVADLFPAGEAALECGAALKAALAPPVANTEDDEEESAAGWRTNPTPQLLATREALRGREVVLVGGVERANASLALIEAFGLADLHWLSSGEHQSLTRFEAYVARPETALVIVMIRWASHSYEGLKQVAEKYGKMYLRLPGGYSPNQIAHQFMQQNSLRAAKPQAT